MSVDTGRFRAAKPALFVIHDDEEVRLRAVLRERCAQMKVLASYDSDLKGALKDVRKIVLTMRPLDSVRIAELTCEAHLRGIRVVDFESTLLELDPTVPATSVEVIRMLAQKGRRQSYALRLYSRAKAFVQPLLALTLLTFLSPLFLLVALAVKLTSRGPAFYSQTRLGLNGRTFEILKFRSMRLDAEKNGPVWASAQSEDPRLTSIGAFLRATHLDELPQLLNVVRGELNFVGPRPERPVFCDELAPLIPLFKLRTLVKPGITGWAQIRHGYGNTIEDARRKLEFDMFYILRHSPRLDLAIVLGTLAVLISGGTEGIKRGKLEPAAPHRSHGTPWPAIIGLLALIYALNMKFGVATAAILSPPPGTWVAYRSQGE